MLFKRALLSQLRNPTDTSSRLLMSTWVGTLAGKAVFQPSGCSYTRQPRSSPHIATGVFRSIKLSKSSSVKAFQPSCCSFTRQLRISPHIATGLFLSNQLSKLSSVNSRGLMRHTGPDVALRQRKS